MRITVSGARSDRLYFAQVYEDPVLEIEALAPESDETVVAVTSGGCTVLSLLGAGAGRVVAVDLNISQNHMLELKSVAVARLSAREATAFLGGRPAQGRERLKTYGRLSEDLSTGARAYWDEHRRWIRRGVLVAGVSERFLYSLVRFIRFTVHPASRMRQLLACRTLKEQRTFYDREWNTWRWRLLYRLLLGRRMFSRTYDPAFYEHLEKPSFAEHFLRVFEHTVTELPVGTNYFLHRALTGFYADNGTDGVPLYLSEDGAAAVRAAPDRLTIVDGPYTEYLRTCADGSVHGFALSNICEWLEPAEIDELFREVVRTAVPGARVCFRNFVGWTEVPDGWRDRVVEDRERGEALSRRDRSMANRRFVFCTIRKGAL